MKKQRRFAGANNEMQDENENIDSQTNVSPAFLVLLLLRFQRKVDGHNRESTQSKDIAAQIHKVTSKSHTKRHHRH